MGLINCFKNAAIEKKVKTSALICLGDLALGFGDNFGPYLGEVLHVFEMACGAAYQLRQTRDLDQLDYAEELSEVIVESFTGVVHGTQGTSLEPLVKVHAIKIIPFLFYVCAKEMSPTVVKLVCINSHD